MPMTDETLLKRLTNARTELARHDKRIEKARAAVENYDADLARLTERRDAAREAIENADTTAADARETVNYLDGLAARRGLDTTTATTPDEASAPTEDDATGYVPPAGA